MSGAKKTWKNLDHRQFQALIWEFVREKFPDLFDETYRQGKITLCQQLVTELLERVKQKFNFQIRPEHMANSFERMLKTGDINIIEFSQALATEKFQQDI